MIVHYIPFVYGWCMFLLFMLNSLQWFATISHRRCPKTQPKAQSVIVLNAHRTLPFCCLSIGASGFLLSQSAYGPIYTALSALDSIGLAIGKCWLFIVAFKTIDSSFLTQDIPLPPHLASVLIICAVLPLGAVALSLIGGVATDTSTWWCADYICHVATSLALMALMLAATQKLRHNLLQRDSNHVSIGTRRKNGLTKQLRPHVRMVAALSIVCLINVLFYGLFTLDLLTAPVQQFHRPRPVDDTGVEELPMQDLFVVAFSFLSLSVVTFLVWHPVTIQPVVQGKVSSSTGNTLRARKDSSTHAPTGSPKAPRVASSLQLRSSTALSVLVVGEGLVVLDGGGQTNLEVLNTAIERAISADEEEPSTGDTKKADAETTSKNPAEAHNTAAKDSTTANEESDSTTTNDDRDSTTRSNKDSTTTDEDKDSATVATLLDGVEGVGC